VLLKEEDDNDDEMVFYSEPVAAEAGKWYVISFWTKTESINTEDGMFGTAVTPEFINNRLGLCFFFHKAPLETNWDLVGGDQFVYLDQRTGKENQDWTKITVIAQAPEEAAGFSMRARFNNFPTGSVWYDDFAFQEATLIPTAIEEFGKHGAKIVTEYMLRNNYPNPFNPITNIEYYVPKAGSVSLVVYNVVGQKVRTLIEGHHNPGTFHAIWDGCNNAGEMLSSGVYFYQLKGTDAVITKKMTFIK
ncbi:MAG: T9SS type A sorting domain-containing protein, partial [Calditrichaceae bacterium]|nr:T9SS type A sorting domain-containing protein [Calditrichaceae bacterium]